MLPPYTDLRLLGRSITLPFWEPQFPHLQKGDTTDTFFLGGCILSETTCATSWSNNKVQHFLVWEDGKPVPSSKIEFLWKLRVFRIGDTVLGLEGLED